MNQERDTPAQNPPSSPAYELHDKGSLAMICSEMVFRAYYDAGVSLLVKPWNNMAGFSTWVVDVRSDFVTPNMLFLGGSFTPRSVSFN